MTARTNGSGGGSGSGSDGFSPAETRQQPRVGALRAFERDLVCHRVLLVHRRHFVLDQRRGKSTGRVDRNERVLDAVLREHCDPGRGLPVDVETVERRGGAHRENAGNVGAIAAAKREQERERAALGEPRNDRFVA